MTVRGLSACDVSDRVHVDVSQVAKMVRERLKILNVISPADEEGQILLQLARIDSLEAAVHPMAVGRIEVDADGNDVVKVPPDLDAVRAELGIINSRTELLGLSKQRVEHSGVNGRPLVSISFIDRCLAAPDEDAHRVAASGEGTHQLSAPDGDTHQQAADVVDISSEHNESVVPSSFASAGEPVAADIPADQDQDC